MGARMNRFTRRLMDAALSVCLYSLILSCGAPSPAPTAVEVPTPTFVPNGPSESPTFAPSPSSDSPTDGWILLSSPTGSYSFRHPTNWNFSNCPGDSFSAASAQLPDGGCHGEGSGSFEALVLSIAGDHRSAPANHEYLFVGTVQSSSQLVVDGSTGTRFAALISQDPGMGPAAGTTQVLYVFYAGGRTYLLLYQHQPSLADRSATFDTLVSKTLRFSA